MQVHPCQHLPITVLLGGTGLPGGTGLGCCQLSQALTIPCTLLLTGALFGRPAPLCVQEGGRGGSPVFARLRTGVQGQHWILSPPPSLPGAGVCSEGTRTGRWGKGFGVPHGVPGSLRSCWTQRTGNTFGCLQGHGQRCRGLLRGRGEGGRGALCPSYIKKQQKKGGGGHAMCCEFPGTLTVGDGGGGSPCISFCLVVLAGSFVYTAPVRPFKLLLMF